MRKIKHGRLAGGCSDACCLKLEGLSVHIQGEDILEDVSFHLHCGEIAAIIGHNFPVWLKFKGGKGVASTFGFILVINPAIALMALATWLVFAFLFRYSSLAALAAAVLTPLYAYFYAGEVESVFFTAVALLVVVRHHANIRRLIKGEESKISFGKKDNTTGNTKENGQDKAESAKK